MQLSGLQWRLKHSRERGDMEREKERETERERESVFVLLVNLLANKADPGERDRERDRKSVV